MRSLAPRPGCDEGRLTLLVAAPVHASDSFLPAKWNGRLILYAHGFIDPAAPIALPDVAPADVAPWVVQLRETLISQGYAVAYSS